MGTTKPTKHRSLHDGDIEDALGSKAHRRILAACIKGAASVKQVSAATGLPLASTYRNIHGLIDRGLLIVERSAMTEDGKPYDLYRSRLKEASLRISAQGVEVSWNVNPSVEDRLLNMWSYLR